MPETLEKPIVADQSAEQAINAAARAGIAELDKQIAELFKTRKDLAAKLPFDDAVKFPAIPNGPAVFFETDRKEAWIGIPFELMPDWNFIQASIDRAKFDVLNYFAAFMREEIERQKRLADARGPLAKLLQRGQILLKGGR